MEQNNRDIKPNSFFLGLNTDVDPQFLNKEGQYTYALNSKLNTHNGNRLTISNEPSNIKCVDFPTNLTLIGSIELSERRHAVFFTDNTNNEIGIYNEVGCTYEKVVGGTCLNFNTSNLIVGGSRENVDCSETIYWADGNRNPRRYLKLDEIPYTFTQVKQGDCYVKQYTNILDCNQLLAEKNVSIPKINIELGTSGQLEDGVYQVGIVYTDKGQKVTDVLSITEPQSIFSHGKNSGELELTFEGLDINFDEFQLVLIATINQQTTYKIFGTYSTDIKSLSVYENKGTTITVEDVVISTPSWYGADGFVSAGDYALWYGVKTRPELNYQKQANNIRSKWVAYRVPKNYYKNGGNKVGYYRDEVYSFGIQWLYKNGKYGPVYHIPGRTSKSSDLEIIMGNDSFETQSNICKSNEAIPKWKGYGTASGGVIITNEDECSEYVAGEGEMSYHESVEEYPNKPEVWGALSCKKIRHHKFPSSKITHIHNNNIDDNSIIILGVKFENIEHPKDFDGNPEKDIVGYRIVRESRKGNRSVIARGLLFNMRSYTHPTTNKETLYQNYPFNDLREDPYLSNIEFPIGSRAYSDLHKNNKLNQYSFHSPLPHFEKPKLNATELKIETEEIAETYGEWNEVYKHPKQKIIRDFGFLLAGIVGMSEAVVGIVGKRTVQYTANPSPLGGELASVFGSGTGYGTLSLILYYVGVGIQAAANTLIAGAVMGGAFLEPWLIPAGVVFADSPRRAAKWIPGTNYSHRTDGTAYNSFTGGYNVLTGTFAFPVLFNEGATKALDLLYAAIPAIQYAYQYNGVANYSKYINQTEGDIRRGIELINYLQPVVQQFGKLTVNNYKRESAIILKTTANIKVPTNIDTSRGIPEEYNACKTLKHSSKASSYYATLKIDRPGQYGQMYNKTYIGTDHLENNITTIGTYSTEPVFGGDCYINKFTVKRKMHYFNQTGFDEKDGWEFDYRNYYNISYPTHWLDSRKFDPLEWYNGGGLFSKSGDFSGSDGDNDPANTGNTGENDVSDPSTYEGTTNNAQDKRGNARGLLEDAGWELPHKHRFFSCEKPYKFSFKNLRTIFYVEDGKFYLTNNGVINYYVESDFNLDLRDWDEEIQFRHYDEKEYTDLESLFRSDIQDFDNYYKFDKSYKKELTEISAFSQIYSYNPDKAETCYTYYPNQIIYSLPANRDSLKDNWLVYLNNNKYKFPKENGKITGVKYLDRQGLMFFFDNASPYLHQTIDTLKTDSNLKITIGDGGLFSREPVPLSVTDYAFGNCQSQHAFKQTQFGLFYPSQRQGRVFLYNGQLKDITEGKEWWFKKYLPSRLLEQFPEYPLKDNPVKGVGLLSAYDNTDAVFYLHKRDFELKDEYKDLVKFDGTDFYIESETSVCPDGYTFNSQLNVCEKVEYSQLSCSAGDVFNPITGLCESVEGGNCDTDLVFLVDRSGSVNEIEKQQIDSFVTNVISLLSNDIQAQKTKVGIIMFDSSYAIATNLTFDLTAINNGITHPGSGAGGSTNMLRGLCITKEMLLGLNSRPTAKKRILLITDGAQQGNTTQQVCGRPSVLQNELPSLYELGNELKTVHNVTITTFALGTPDERTLVRKYVGNEWNIPIDPGIMSIPPFMYHPNPPQGYPLTSSGNNFFQAEFQDAQTFVQQITNVLSCNKVPYPPKCLGVIEGNNCKTIIRVDPNIKGKTIVDLESIYFTNCSFTMSYDLRNSSWISFHSWNPSWVFQDENHFSTVKNNSVWKHNISCNNYCNFYGKQYTWEVEYLFNSQQVEILSSLEYYLEAYKHLNNCKDSHHLLDYNFNKFFIYNSEQNSGLRIMDIADKDNPHKIQEVYNLNNNIKVKYYKEEQKYRINNFDDITRNRGEFSEHIAPVINIHPNGYTRTINEDWVDYTKKFSERKKFRHLWNKVVLIKDTGEEPMYHMILKLILNKTVKSYR